MTSDQDIVKFGFKKSLAATWITIRDYWFILMTTAFLRELISIVMAGLVFMLLGNLRIWNITIALLVRFVVWSALQGGYLRLCLNATKNDQVKWSDLFSGLRFCLPMLLATLCFSVAVAFGLVLLIVPGLILLVRFSLFGLVLVDQNAGPLKSLRTSHRMITGFARYAAGFLLLYVIGVLISGLHLAFEPFLVIALCVLYNHIRAHEVML